LPITEITGVCAGFDGEQLEVQLLKGPTEFIFEPGASQVLGALLPYYLNFRMYQVLLEAKASEHSARRVAMKNATDNAEQLIEHLTLEYNKLRQSLITKELLEIATAAMAME
jgi:F-type H+-transporting ATPase subunit gamma